MALVFHKCALALGKLIHVSTYSRSHLQFDCCSMATEDLQLFPSKYLSRVDDTCFPSYFALPRPKDSFCTDSNSFLHQITSDSVSPQHRTLLP